jgi:hypothetical protein
MSTTRSSEGAHPIVRKSWYSETFRSALKVSSQADAGSNLICTTILLYYNRTILWRVQISAFQI